MNTLAKLVLIIFFITVLLTLIVTRMTIPKLPKDMTNNITSTQNAYLWSIYNQEVNPEIMTNFNWYWNNMPESIQKANPIADNLSFSWPPKKGQRFRMTAFPYPDTGKSKFWLFQFIKGMSSLLDNTSDQVTFPGWLVSIYNPMHPNKNSWQKFLEAQIPWDKEWGASRYQNIKHKSKPFKPVYMEVLHSCYIPPNLDYPACDDGGYWLYGVSGSGIFWQCGGYNPDERMPGKFFKGTGGCLVANNKIDAMLKLMETNIGKFILKYKHNNLTPIQYMVNRLKDGGGGYSLVNAMMKVIKAFHNKYQIPDIVAFRNMTPSTAKNGWIKFLFTTILFTVFLLVFLGYCIRNVIRSFQHKKSWSHTLLTIVAFIIVFLVVIRVQWYVVTESMLVNFGYMTLDMAIRETNMELEEFIYAAAGRDKNGNYTDVYNSVANSLAQIQQFDFDLDTFCNINKLDSIIMHTQPNKSGSWAVEIMDVRNTPFKKDAKKISDLVFSLGLCGVPLDGSKDNMPPLMQGPLDTNTSLYFGYQPTKMCDCNEDIVAKQYDKTGVLKKCLFCQGSISQQLC